MLDGAGTAGVAEGEAGALVGIRHSIVRQKLKTKARPVKALNDSAIRRCLALQTGAVVNLFGEFYMQTVTSFIGDVMSGGNIS